MTKIDLRGLRKIELSGRGWIEIEGENSKLNLFFDGADIMKIKHSLHDTKIIRIDDDNSSISEKEAEIIIELYREDI